MTKPEHIAIAHKAYARGQRHALLEISKALEAAGWTEFDAKTFCSKIQTIFDDVNAEPWEGRTLAWSRVDELLN